MFGVRGRDGKVDIPLNKAPKALMIAPENLYDAFGSALANYSIRLREWRPTIEILLSPLTKGNRSANAK